MMNESKVEVYILLRCPQCKKLIEKYPPGKWDAVSDKDMFRCADCGVDYMIRFDCLTRATELRNEAIRAGADELGKFVSCPKCGNRRNQYDKTVAFCQHCGDLTFVYVA